MRYALLLAFGTNVAIYAVWDPKLKAFGALGVGAVAMTAAKKMEKNPFVQKISSKTGLDPLDVAGAVGISAGCLTLSCFSNEQIAPVFVKYAVRAPLAAILGFFITTDIFNDTIVNTPLIGEFLARKPKKYSLMDADGKQLDMSRCKLINENGDIEKITGEHYSSNYRCRGTILSAAAYFAIDAGINALVKKYDWLKFLNGQ